LTSAAEKPSMPSFKLVVAMRSAACMRSKVALSMAIFSICMVLAFAGSSLRGRSPCGGLRARPATAANGEQVAAGELGDLADVAEARAHDHGLVAEFLEVVVDGRHRLHAGIVGALVVLARVLLVPVENAADEGRDERDAGIGAAMAWCRPKSSVRLQWMPSFSRTSAA
jgi:hypothetical protein